MVPLRTVPTSRVRPLASDGLNAFLFVRGARRLMLGAYGRVGRTSEATSVNLSPPRIENDADGGVTVTNEKTTDIDKFFHAPRR